MYGGYYNDINNTISFYDAYQPGTDFPTDIGVPQAGSMTGPTAEVIPSSTAGNVAAPAGAGQSAHWWLMLAIVFGGFVFVARRYSGDSQYGNIKASVYNMVFLTIYVVIMLNFLKVLAAKFPIPGLSALILAA